MIFFHESFIPRARDVIASQVLPRYFVKIDEHVYVHESESESRRFVGRADVAVAHDNFALSGATATTAAVAPAEVWQAATDEERVSYLQVRDRESQELVTVIELLSPANKAGRDRDAFLSKRDALLWGSVHYVEIDLLRGGPRLPWLKMPPCDYYAAVSRWEQRPRAGFWPLHLRDRLPEIPIPLRHGDADAKLDLQDVLNQIYDAAGYQYYIYKQLCTPPLSEADQEWANQLVSGSST